MAQVDPRDMLNNFCFHFYAQKSVFIGENVNGFLAAKQPYKRLGLAFAQDFSQDFARDFGRHF